MTVQSLGSRLGGLEPRVAAVESGLQAVQARINGLRIFGAAKAAGPTCQQHCRNLNNARGSCLTALGGASLEAPFGCDFAGGPVLCVCLSD
jgi:hypothetical protein